MGQGYFKQARRVLGSGGCTDNYINPGVDTKLPTPPELADKDLRIKMLLEDVERSNAKIAGLELANAKLRKRVESLKKEIAALMNKPDLAKRTVKQIREERGISCRKLAQMMGVTHDSLNKRELGRMRWRRCYVDRACEVLGIKESDVTWGEIIER